MSAPGRTLRAEESESYPCDADTVWSLIRPAESAVLLSNAARAFTVPGTPTGVGEQQTFVRADGSAATVEVVEEAAPYWAKTITVAPTKDGMVQTYQIEPSESGCTLTMGMTATIPAIPGFSRRYEKMWRKDARRYLSRVKETVISGAARYGKTITRGNRRELPHAAPIHLLSWTLPTYNPVFVVFYGVYLVLGPFIVERDPGPLDREPCAAAFRTDVP